MVDIATAPRPEGGVLPIRRPAIDPAQLADAVLTGNRAAIGRAITLVESRRDDHRALAADLLVRLQPKAGNAQRVGITGVPGVGKSTFIESFGKYLTGQGHKVAVLAVDPSSTRTGGSILGDKTRMAELSVDPNAFIRPSPSSGTLGGVTRMTRESMVVLEAAGYDVVLVETVGAGQSETAVAEMCDFFLVLMLPGAGDELQGIKKGVLEIADMIAVNKSDGDNALRARRAAAEYRRALHIMTPISPNWRPPVVLISGLTGMGLDELWGEIENHKKVLTETGERKEKRRKQQLRWMWQLVRDRLLDALHESEDVDSILGQTEREVGAGRITASLAADRLLHAFGVK
ncbi:MAG: methylmalonyl Co-A mutase-associated GTPase MeaB [Rhodospirillaceae bacterium]|nr:methylmalonyl Co-A mutase-associated GTPase MeaB [Rhodospirillaceae bacterium]